MLFSITRLTQSSTVSRIYSVIYICRILNFLPSILYIMYTKLLEKHPAIIKCITSGIIMSAGDLLAQKLINNQPDVNWQRNFNMFIAGTFYVGSCLHVWHCRALPQFVTRTLGNNSTNLQAQFTGVVYGQLLFAPFFLAGFYLIEGTIKDQASNGIQSGINLVKNNLWETIKTSWLIWPLATMINTVLIPFRYQAIFANLVGLFWNMYLSYMSYR